MSIIEERKNKIQQDFAKVDEIIAEKDEQIKSVKATLREQRALKLAALEEEMKSLAGQYGLSRLREEKVALQAEKKQFAMLLKDCQKIIINTEELDKVWELFNKKFGCWQSVKPEIDDFQEKEFPDMYDLESMQKVMKSGQFKDDALSGMIEIHNIDFCGESGGYRGSYSPDFDLPCTIHLNSLAKNRETGEIKHIYDFVEEFFCYCDCKGKKMVSISINYDILWYDYPIEIDLASLENNKKSKLMYKAIKHFFSEAFSKAIEEGRATFAHNTEEESE